MRNLEDALDSYCELNEEGKIAFRMATEALELFGNSEQLPSAQPEPCEDAVSRKYILNCLAEYIEEYGELDSNGLHDLKWCAMKEAEMVVKDAPSVISKQIECEDAVSREAAIDVAENAFVRGLLASPDIRRLPSAQSEIVTCKDCKHIQKWRSEESAKKFGQIYECARGVLNCPKPEDFCSHAERRTTHESKQEGLCCN